MDEEELEQRELRAIRRMAEVVIRRCGQGEGDEVDRLLEHYIEMERQDEARMAELDQLVPANLCFVCEGPVPSQIGMEERGHDALRFCGKCGGRKRQNRLRKQGFGELLDRFGARKRLERHRVEPAPVAPEPEADPEPDWDELGDVQLPSTKENRVSDEVQGERFCPTEGCGKKLRRDNTKGLCGRCQSGHKGHLGAAVDPARPRKPRSAKSTAVRTVSPDVGDRFRVVAETLDLDPDEVLRELMSGWLDELKSKVKAA